MMIICLNDLEKINPILRDRLHIIHIPGYNADEKCTIVNKYIIPKLHTQYKIDICIEKDVIDYIISNTSQHKGIRQLIMYLTKIYELAVLDKFTYKFNFDGKFKLKDLTHIKLSELSDKPIMSMYV
jgi:ATP-dependent Lon protease